MREEEKEKGRGEVSGSRVISPSQHRPLNSTPLVETKSDTRKAKLLQMHKPFSIRPPPLHLPSPAHTAAFPLRLLSHPHPHPPLRSLQSPRASSSFSAASFDSCSFQLPTYTQSTLFIAKMSFCNSPFLFLYLLSLPSLFLLFPLSPLLSLSPLFFFFLCVVQGHSTVLFSLFLSFSTSEKSPAPDFFSITLFLN